MSRGDSGVAYIAWNVRCQLSPPMIGNVASNAADCIDVATSRPGARNWRYVTPPSAAVDPTRRRTPPSPMPIAVRNSSGVRNDVNTDERNVRRYWSARCSMTWVTPAIGVYSISERPVSRRKTSSSVDRRTRTVSG